MLPEVVDFPRCSIVGIDWYVKMPTDPAHADPKMKGSLSNVGENVPQRNQPFLREIVGFHFEMGGYIHQNENTTTLVSQIKNVAG